MIRYDNSYISRLGIDAIERNLASYDVDKLRIEIRNSEEQIKKNQELHTSLNKEAWEVYCDNARHEKSDRILGLLNALNKRFKIYQFDKSVSYLEDWHLFFWCNCDKNGEHDYSYITLNFNDRCSYEQRQETFKEVLDFLSAEEYSEIDIAVQKDVFWDEEKLNQAYELFCKTHEGKFIEYNGMKGYIRQLGSGEYVLFKKYAKKTFYRLAKEIVGIMAVNEKLIA